MKRGHPYVESPVPQSLDDLLDDFSLETFLAEVAERDVWRGRLRDPSLATQLWARGIPAEDATLRTDARLDRDDVRLVQKGAHAASPRVGRDRQEPLEDSDAEAIARAVAGGHTLATTLRPPRTGWLGVVVAMIEASFSCPCHAVLYATPPDARGFDLHHDVDDVFVFQLAGAKHWTIAEPREVWPLDNGGYEPDAISSRDEFVLTPGDVLYLPRGTIHAAETRASGSAHLTVSTMRKRMYEAELEALVAALGDAAQHELPEAMWDDPAREDALCSALTRLLARYAPPGEDTRANTGSTPDAPPPRRGWLARALWPEAEVIR
jgi:mannose-6-phosphate isomerase-like protein (cupin superfamily)